MPLIFRMTSPNVPFRSTSTENITTWKFHTTKMSWLFTTACHLPIRKFTSILLFPARPKKDFRKHLCRFCKSFPRRKPLLSCSSLYSMLLITRQTRSNLDTNVTCLPTNYCTMPQPIAKTALFFMPGSAENCLACK